MQNGVRFTVFIVLLIFLVSTQSVLAEVIEAPKRFVLDHQPPKKPSVVVLNTEINLSALRDQLDAAISAVTPFPFSGKRSGCARTRVLGIRISIGCTWHGEVKKRGPLVLTGQGNSLTIRLPLHAFATVRGRSEVGKHIRETVTTDFIVIIEAPLQNCG